MIDNTNKALGCSGEGRVIYPQLDGRAEQVESGNPTGAAGHTSNRMSQRPRHPGRQFKAVMCCGWRLKVMPS